MPAKNPTADIRPLMELMTPAGYARLRLGWELYPWQTAVMEAMDERGARVAVKTCNEAGKTSRLISGLVLWHMETFRDSLTVTTSGTYRQVSEQLFPSLRGLSGRLGEGWEFGNGWGRNNKTGSRLVSFSTDDPGKAEGWHEPMRPTSLAIQANPLEGFGVKVDDWKAMAGHADRTSLMMIVDEAKTPPASLFEAFERCHATRWLNASSPGMAFGPFYDCFGRGKDRWKTFSAAAKDCPHLWNNPERRRELEEQMRTLRPELVSSMIDAEFMATSSGAVFDVAAVDKAMQKHNAVWGRGQFRRAAIDLSGGGDEQVLYLCDGNNAWCEWAGNEPDDRKLVATLLPILKRWMIKPECCYADDGGLGQLIINEFHRQGYLLERFNFGAAAHDSRLYLNRRAEIYFTLADAFRRGAINVRQDDVLREELAFTLYVPYAQPLRLVPKKQLPRSPNRSDALAMLFSELPDPAGLTPLERENEQRLSVTTSFERETLARGLFDE